MCTYIPTTSILGQSPSSRLNNGLPALTMAENEVRGIDHSNDGPREPQQAPSLANHVSRRSFWEDLLATPALANTLNDPRRSTEDQISAPLVDVTDQEAPDEPPSTNLEGANKTDEAKPTFHQDCSEDISVESRRLRKSKTSVVKEIAFGLLGFLLALMFIGRDIHSKFCRLATLTLRGKF